MPQGAREQLTFPPPCVVFFLDSLLWIQGLFWSLSWYKFKGLDMIKEVVDIENECYSLLDIGVT